MSKYIHIDIASQLNVKICMVKIDWPVLVNSFRF